MGTHDALSRVRRHAWIGLSTLAAACTDPLFNQLPEVVSLSGEDHQAPLVSIVTPTPGELVSGDVTWLVQAEDPGGAVASVALFVDGAPVSTLSVPPYSFVWDSTDAADGTVQLRAVASDANANQAEASVAVNVDNTPPAFVNIVSAPNPATSGDTVVVTFTASEALSGNPSVTVAGNSATIGSGSGNDYSFDYIVTGAEAEGAATIVIQGTDVADNVGSTTGSVVLDSAGPIPSALFTPPPASATHVPLSFSLSMSFTDAGAGLASCEVCVSTDGVCDSEWAAGSVASGVCNGVGLSCTSGNTLTLGVRGVDGVGNATTAPTATRICAAGPIPGSTLVQGPATTTHVATGFNLSAPFASSVGVSSCEACVSTDGQCDSEWVLATFSTGTCTAAGLPCNDGDTLTLALRATDTLFNSTSTVPVTRACDGQGPIGGTVTPSNQATATHVGGSFQISATFADPATVASCQVCNAADGTCDSEWTPTGAIFSGGACTATGLACTNGDTRTLNLRATDGVGNVGTAVAVTRTCDTQAPSAGTVSLAGSATATNVGADFEVSATFTDAGAGVGSCEVCVSLTACSGGAWRAATLVGNTCTASGETCSPSGGTMSIAMRARDALGNPVGGVETSVISRSCDLVAVDPPAPLAANELSSGFVDGTFDASVSWGAVSGAPIVACEVCVSTDGLCDDEWVGADLTGSTCEAFDLTCTDDEALTLRMRLFDAVDNVGMSAPAVLTCDTQSPSYPVYAPFVRTSRREIDVEWLAATDGDGVGVASYDLSWDTNGSPYSNTQSTPGLLMNLTGLDDCQEYFFRLDAVDAVGNDQDSETFVNTRCGGDGSLASGPSPIAAELQHVQTADMNADGILDLVGVGWGVAPTGDGADPVRVSLGSGSEGRGNGSFAAATPYTTGEYPGGLALADFNADGILDVATPAYPTHVYIQLGAGTGGRGTGALGSAVGYTFPASLGTPISIVPGDFNDDGIVDLLVGTYTGSRADLGFFRGLGSGGRGNGAFFDSPAPTVSVTSTVWGIARLRVGDLNGDGIEDAVALVRTSFDIFLGNGSNGRGNGTFAATTPLDPVGEFIDFVLADVNSDAILDIVATHYSTASNVDGISVFLGAGTNGVGTAAFGAATAYPPGAPSNIDPGSLLVEDLDNDGIPDVVATDSQGDECVVMLGGGANGRGDGTFRNPTTSACSDGPVALTTADVNSDGRLDVAVSASNAGETIVRLGGGKSGVGDATFTLNRTLAAPGGPFWVAVGDVNDDAVLDLVVAQEADDSVAVLLGFGTDGQGTGLFTDPVPYNVGVAPRAVALGDFNEDGINDLVTANSGSNDITVRLGNGSSGRGDGTFGAASTLAVGTAPVALALADLNDDTILDLLVANSGSDNVTRLLGTGANGNGDGGFGSPLAYASNTPVALLVADINRDGINDMLALSSGDDQVRRRLGLGTDGVGNGTFASGTGYSTGDAPADFVIGDFNRDAIWDLAVTNSGSNNVSILIGAGTNGVGTGVFGAPSNIAVGLGPAGIAAYDFDRDAILDLAVLHALDGDIDVLLGGGSGGRGDGTFAFSASYNGGTSPGGIALGDFDSDGIKDLLVGADNGFLRVRLGGGTYP